MDEGTVQAKPLAEQITPIVQRQLDPQEQEEEDEENVVVQPKRQSSPAAEVGPSMESRIGSLRGGGASLDRQTRSYLEPRFGYDFSRVRIHTDSKSADVARSIQSRAFTVGRDVVFGAGQYAPGTPTGQRLLAHELTHVVQQGDHQARHTGRTDKRNHSAIADPVSRVRSSGQRIQRIPRIPENTPFDGEIVPWSTPLHKEPSRQSTPIVDLPRGHRVRVLEGEGWIQVSTRWNGEEVVGYVSHELIKEVAGYVWSPSEPAQIPPLAPGLDRLRSEEAASSEEENDGCSVPGFLEWVLQQTEIMRGGKDNPAGGDDTAFANGEDGPCDRHDKCYGEFRGGSLVHKEGCDRNFLRAMREVCKQSKDTEEIKRSCDSWAILYYAAMQTKASKRAYMKAQKEAAP